MEWKVDGIAIRTGRAPRGQVQSMGDVDLSTATGDQAQLGLAQSPANLKRPKPPSDQCGQPEAASPPQYRAVVHYLFHFVPLFLSLSLRWASLSAFTVEGSKAQGTWIRICHPQTSLSPTNPIPLTQHPPTTTTIPPSVPITPLLVLPIPYSRGPGN